MRHLVHFVIGLLFGILCLGAAAWTAMPSQADTVAVISRSDCARLVVHHPAPNVAYQPGVDVQGRPVVPADLPGSNPPIATPEEIAVDITVELRRQFGIPANSALYKPEAAIGTVVVKPDGSATFNGQPLTSPEAQALSALCRQHGKPTP
jgi:hypothetical protein